MPQYLLAILKAPKGTLFAIVSIMGLSLVFYIIHITKQNSKLKYDKISTDSAYQAQQMIAKDFAETNHKIRDNEANFEEKKAKIVNKQPTTKDPEAVINCEFENFNDLNNDC